MIALAGMVVAGLVAIGGLTTWVLRMREGKQANIAVDYHRPPNGSSRLILTNHGPAQATRVAAKLEGRWLESGGAFTENRPTGFSLAPQSQIELTLLESQLPLPGPKTVEVHWRDDTARERMLTMSIRG